MRTLLERTRDEIERDDAHWSRKVVAINLYHNYKLQANTRQTLADTATELGVSRAYISEAIKLAEALPDNPNLISYSRRKAMLKVRLS